MYKSADRILLQLLSTPYLNSSRALLPRFVIVVVCTFSCLDSNSVNWLHSSLLSFIPQHFHQVSNNDLIFDDSLEIPIKIQVFRRDEIFFLPFLFFRSFILFHFFFFFFSSKNATAQLLSFHRLITFSFIFLLLFSLLFIFLLLK